MIGFSDIQTTFTTILAICGGITIIAGAAKALAPLLHPFKKLLDGQRQSEAHLKTHDERLDQHDKYLDNDKKEIQALKAIQEASVKANLAMLHNHLYEACTHHLAAGLITLDEMDNLDCIYEAYHALGGNGTGTRLYERCKALRLKEVDEERQEMRKLP